jgi:hypothetical protein
MERGLRIRHDHRDLKQASTFAGEKKASLFAGTDRRPSFRKLM